MIKVALRFVIALIYFAAGVLHLASPSAFLSITPKWVPMPELLVAFTGIAEIAGAIGLLIPRFRKAAGIGLALYALCVWPANFNHALNDAEIGNSNLSWWYHGPRLAFQPIFIWLALWVGEVTRWPFGETK